MTHPFLRSSTDALLAGVCGGLGHYLSIHPNVVRVFFILLSVFSGLGVLLYFLLWLFVPREELPGTSASFPASRAHQFGNDVEEIVHHPNPRLITWLGIAFVTAGVVALIQALGLPFLRFINSNLIWAVVIIGAGLLLIYRALKG